MTEFFRFLVETNLVTAAFVIGAIALVIAIIGKFKTIIEPSPAMRVLLAVFGLFLMALSLGSYFVSSQTKPNTAGTPSQGPISAPVIQPSATIPQAIATTRVPSTQPAVMTQPPSGETLPQVSEIPTTPDEAARKWGGRPSWWEKLSSNGWKLRGALAITVGDGWRIDFTDTNGNIKSCGDKYEPGVYGVAVVSVVEATLWYVPGETKCPSWTIWSQNHS